MHSQATTSEQTGLVADDDCVGASKEFGFSV